MRVDAAKLALFFIGIHFARSEALAARANDLPKHNKTIKACLTNFSIIYHYLFSLTICECLQYH